MMVLPQNDSVDIVAEPLMVVFCLSRPAAIGHTRTLKTGLLSADSCAQPLAFYRRLATCFACAMPWNLFEHSASGQHCAELIN